MGKIELEKYLGALGNALIPRGGKLGALERSKEAGIRAEAMLNVQYSLSIDAEGNAKTYIHAPTNLLDAGAEASSSQTESVEATDTGYIKAEVWFKSDGKQGFFAKLFRGS